MAYSPTFKNKKFEEISTDCGLIIETLNMRITTNEIEYFATHIVSECIRIIEQAGQDALSDEACNAIYQAEKKIREAFGMNP